MDKFLEIVGAIIVSIGGIGVVILGLSSWFGKIWANKFYEKERRKQEEYLKEVQNKLDIKLAELSNQLEKSKVQFELLNKERIEVIKCLYVKLVDMEDYLGLYFRGLTINNVDSKKESIEYSNLITSVSDFMDYNNHNRIFFSEAICKSINEIDAITTIILNQHEFFSKNPEGVEEGLHEKMIDLINKMIKDEIPKFKQELECEFRKIIGVINQ